MLATAASMTISAKAMGQSAVVPSDTEEDNTEDEASAASTAQPAQESPTVAETPSLDSNDMQADGKSSNKIAVGTMFGTDASEHLLTVLAEAKKNKTVFVQREPQNIHHSLISHSFCCLWFTTNWVQQKFEATLNLKLSELLLFF